MTQKPQIPFGMYTRIETLAGGAWASDRAFIRAAWKKLNKSGRSPDQREFRRALYTALRIVRDRVRTAAAAAPAVTASDAWLSRATDIDL